MDSEGTFLPERLSQISSSDFGEVSDFIIVARPTTFGEQADLIDGLNKFMNRRFGLIIFDTVTSLYRSELLNKKETFSLNRELNRQVATLTEMAKTLELSVLLVSQVRSVIAEADVAPVATRVLRFWCDSVVGLSRAGSRSMVKASVEKSGGKETKTSFYLVIGEDGLHDYRLKT
jgi:RecA/RadA recombinase